MKLINFQNAGLIVILLFFSNVVFGQLEEGEINVFFSVPEIALIDIEPSIDNSVHFSIVPSAETGESPLIENHTSQTLWLNYSSATTTPENTRSIMAEISQGTIPEGIILYLEASVYSGTGDGATGYPSGKVSINNHAQQIIAGIGSCYTGDGINNGHSITYSIDISDYSKIHSIEHSDFTILYTITDN